MSGKIVQEAKVIKRKQIFGLKDRTIGDWKLLDGRMSLYGNPETLEMKIDFERMKQ